MGKSEQTGGGGGGTEPKPKQKRHWCKPRVRLVEFAATRALSPRAGVSVYSEGPTFGGAYDPNLS